MGRAGFKKKEKEEFPDFKRCVFFIFVSVGILSECFSLVVGNLAVSVFLQEYSDYQPCFAGGCTEGRRMVGKEYLNQVHLGFSSVS